jgi:FKBP-type peptidyl-prolyl cis-trans isomerase FkpA
MKKLTYLIALLAVCTGTMAQENFLRTPKGVQYRVINPKQGERIKLNDVITFNVIQKTEKDSILFNTYTGGQPMKLQVQPSQNAGDMMEVFMLLTAKDSAIVRVPADSIFKDHEESRPAFLPKKSTIVFAIKIEQVQSLNEAIAERNAAMEKLRTDELTAGSKYILAHNLAVKTTPSGLKYAITRASVKRKAMAGDTLLVNYIGRTLDDKVFDTSLQAEAMKAGLQQPGRNYEPIKVVVGQGQVIQGWDEGLLLLNEGSKATFVIPSSLAYGQQGAGNDIKPFSTLVFDLEVVSVKPRKRIAATATKKPGAKSTAKKPAAKTSAKKKTK